MFFTLACWIKYLEIWKLWDVNARTSLVKCLERVEITKQLSTGFCAEFFAGFLTLFPSNFSLGFPEELRGVRCAAKIWDADWLFSSDYHMIFHSRERLPLLQAKPEIGWQQKLCQCPGTTATLSATCNKSFGAGNVHEIGEAQRDLALLLVEQWNDMCHLIKKHHAIHYRSLQQSNQFLSIHIYIHGRVV